LVRSITIKLDIYHRTLRSPLRERLSNSGKGLSHDLVGPLLLGLRQLATIDQQIDDDSSDDAPPPTTTSTALPAEGIARPTSQPPEWFLEGNFEDIS